MSAKIRERADETGPANVARSQPVVDVDCSQWEAEIPEAEWSTGNLVNVVRNQSALDGGMLQKQAEKKAEPANRIQPQDLPQFLRRFRFPGGRVRGVRIRQASEKNISIEFRLTVREAIRDLGAEAKSVRLKLRLTGVEEFRVQMRPNLAKVKIADARIAHLNGLFFVTFDALSLDPSERPQVYDFRASELFAAGRDLEWEEL